MKAQLFFQSNNTKEYLAEILRQIIISADPEAVLLISATYNYQFTENVFIKSPLWDSVGSSYELLVLTDNRTAKSWDGLETVIRSRIPQGQNLRFLQRSIQEFNKKVESGEDYENFVLSNAMLSYYKGRIPLAFPRTLATV